MGSMAVEGSVLHWVAVHRKHHQHSDGEADPHSPHAHGGGFRGTLKGMWHAHIGWSLGKKKKEDLSKYVYDLKKQRVVVWVSNLFPLWVAIGLALPAALGGLLTMSWMGVLLGFLWGGLVRVMLVHHATWSINSVCHLWGSRPYRSNDESRNNVVFGVLALGEGWHNNHHAFPTSARHGLAWWQLDVSYLVIVVMSWLGLASNVKVPDHAKRAQRRVAGA
jgi:stearoyl-CoA desaturase (delta-9 desaturase)